MCHGAAMRDVAAPTSRGRWLDRHSSSFIWGTVVAFVLLAGCRGEQAVPVVDNEPREHRELRAAVDAFVKAGRTPEAYRVFAESLASKRSRMDASVAREAELRLVTLAVAPFESVHDFPVARQAQTLGLTVWPHLLGPSVASSSTDVPLLLPAAEENVADYLDRLCRGVARECAQAPAEARAGILSRLAAERALRRTNDAVRTCHECREPGWHEIRRRWEAIVRWTSAQSEEAWRTTR